MKLKNKEVKIDANIPVIEFKEENIYYYYTPALDVYGYGKTKKEAAASFEICIEEFFRYTIENGTLHEVLTNDLGWKIKTKDEQPIITVPNIFTAIKRSQDVYKSLVATDFQKFNKTVAIPVSAL